MDKETKNILKILGVAVLILYLFRPKNKDAQVSKRKNRTSAKVNLKNSLSAPKQEIDEDKQFKDAVISIKAVRKAINNNEPDKEVEKLNRILIKDYGIKVFKCKDSDKLIARDTKGNEIAKEQ
mgnify:FL=1|tara:strand:+ start:7435 stop:7803 length:369 start_codon:yes stop_codon:yes gene_type:complete